MDSIPSHRIYVPCIRLALCWFWLESNPFQGQLFSQFGFSRSFEKEGKKISKKMNYHDPVYKNDKKFKKACSCASSNGLRHNNKNKDLVGKKSSVDKKSTVDKKTKFISLKKHVTFDKKLLEDMTTNEVKEVLCKMLKLKALPEIECAIKTSSSSRCKYNGRKSNKQFHVHKELDQVK